MTFATSPNLGVPFAQLARANASPPALPSVAEGISGSADDC